MYSAWSSAPKIEFVVRSFIRVDPEEFSYSALYGWLNKGDLRQFRHNASIGGLGTLHARMARRKLHRETHCYGKAAECGKEIILRAHHLAFTQLINMVGMCFRHPTQKSKSISSKPQLTPFAKHGAVAAQIKMSSFIWNIFFVKERFLLNNFRKYSEAIALNFVLTIFEESVSHLNFSSFVYVHLLIKWR